MRIAIVDKELINKEESLAAMNACPVNRQGKECIVLDEEGKASINEELCIGCGICMKKVRKGAIYIINLSEELKEQCIHRYGKNSFALYRSPIPIKEKVVGLLGQNGTGKTTALKILAKDIIPNLGAGKKANPEELSKFFAGSELQGYFSGLEKKKVAYKPQYVDKIPKLFKGTVKKLLEKAQERKILDKVVKDLDLKNCLQTKVSEVSGGELQKAAIAATMLKDADIYFFDEPSSYLDIRERIKVARVIRELAKEKLVMIVEHDLIVLDYLADLSHIFYGKPTAYGIVSFPQSIREGINSYLKGFLKQENVRFREQPIKFIVKTPGKKGETFTLVSFKNLEKKFKSFSLKVPEGEIRNKEIVGVLGPNAIGKTTFMKMLAGVLKADKGKLSREIKISYKAQYIKPEEDTLVQLALKKAPKKMLADLNLENLLDKTLGQLSGGELQRVAVAKCLSEEADLYLLDEPSAHLDVEQRVKVAGLIRKVIDEKEKSAMVIDHDLMFLDYLSDRLMVFLGEAGKSGEGKGPFQMHEGMNLFLKDLDMTFRRDEDTGRPRANKDDSVKDREQKEKGEYYYIK